MITNMNITNFENYQIKTTNKNLSWTIDKYFLSGGNSDIYFIKLTNKINQKATHIIKIEPIENGTLFCEHKFYLKLQQFLKKNKITYSTKIGIPILIDTKKLFYNNKSYRSLIFPLYADTMIQRLEKNKNLYPDTFLIHNQKLAYNVMIQMLDILCKIHELGYIHGDVKGTNIVFENNTEEKILCIDFGHVVSTTNQKSNHSLDGTLEYLSYDGLNKFKTKKGDLETLGYNLLNWLKYTLPWEKLNKNTDIEILINERKKFLDLFLNESLIDFPSCIKKYFRYLHTLNINDIPDYKFCQNLFL